MSPRDDASRHTVETAEDADVESIMNSIFGDEPEANANATTTTTTANDEQAEHDLLDVETRSLIATMIDPDSVDFEPMFKDHSEVPVNYHTEGDTEHHRLLLHRKITGGGGGMSPTTSIRSRSSSFDQGSCDHHHHHHHYDDDDDNDTHSLLSAATTVTASGISVRRAMGQASLTDRLRECVWILQRLAEKTRRKLMVAWYQFSTNDQGKLDYMKLCMIPMLLFIFYVGFHQTAKDSEYLRVKGATTTKSGSGSSSSSALKGGARHHYHRSIVSGSGSTGMSSIGRSRQNGSHHNNHFADHAPAGTVIPKQLDDAFRNVDDLPLGIMDTPIYWHVPRSAGTTMKLILSMCFGRVVACEQGAGHQLDEQLEILNKPFGNFVNVDTSTPLGLERASEMGLIPSRMVDVVLTPHVMEATQLFDTHHKGRLFAMFRDPVERIVSLYYFLRMPDQQATVGLDIQDMTLAEFCADFSENWMVRALTGTMTGPLHERHLHVAKEIVRTKFLIGLVSDKTESLRRFEAYFGWRLPSRVSQTCKNNMFYFEPQSKNIHPEIDRQSKEYDVLVSHNLYDIQLHEYAKFLFEEQRSLFDT